MHLDTHVAVWLHEGAGRRLPRRVRQLLDSEMLAVSPMVGLEIDLLHEIGRTAGPSAEVFAALGQSIGLAVAETPFAAVARAATSLAWTRDPFDRLICAHALADGERLLTKDRRILDHFGAAIWDAD